MSQLLRSGSVGGLFSQLNPSGVKDRAVALTLEQAMLALEASDYRQVARRVCDHGGEVTTLVVLGLVGDAYPATAGSTGVGYIEIARLIYRRETGPAARYDEALCDYILALEAGTRGEALVLLQGAANVLGRGPAWLYYPRLHGDGPRLHGDGPRLHGGWVDVLAGAVRRAMGRGGPLVYVVG